MNDYYSKIKALVKTGAVLETLDSGSQQRTFSRWLGRARQKIESFVPYGFFGSYPAGTKQLLLAKRGNESNIVGLADGSQTRIKKDTKPGEVGLGNPLTKANTYFKEDGSIQTETGEMTVVLFPDGKISISGGSEELISVIDEWMSTMISAKVITGIGIQPFDPTTIAAMTAVQVKLQTFKV